MITLLTGDNNFEVEQVLDQLLKSFDGEPEKFDGAELELRQLPDLLSGQSLFAEKRLVVICELSRNKQLWEVLPDFLERMSEESHLLLVEQAVDKRTKTYKTLQKLADVKSFRLLGERDSVRAERWLMDEAKTTNVQLDTDSVREIIKRSYVMSPKGQSVIDQWQAKHALEKLSVFDEVTVETVKKYIEDQPTNSVFAIFETALKGEEQALHKLLQDLEPREDAFRVFGLLSGQVFQLAMLASSDQSASEVAKTIGVHPFAVSKLTSFAHSLSKKQIKEIVSVFTEADEDMKLSKADPWILIERALIRTSRIVKGK